MRKLALSSAVAAAALAPGFASATNGMNMEGYGPVAAAMGGASMAYDNGAAAMMNNPATIGLMGQGSRLDVAVGRLAPSITSSFGTSSAESSATSFIMPAAGWVAKRGALAYGVGAFAQGGMGTEYSGSSFMSASSGLPTRSEVGVMRIMVPIAYEVNRNLTVGGSLDHVRASMDLQMAMGQAQLMDMMPAAYNPLATRTFGTVSGTLIDGLAAAMNGGQITSLNWGYFDFSDNGKFTGKASGNGFAAKIGLVYRVDSKLSMGAAYHSKTQIKDLEATGATVSLNINGPMAPGGVSGTVPLAGTITIKNFQWPDTIAAGLAYQVTDAFSIVADYKKIAWSGVMKDFQMTFAADTSAGNGGFGGASMDAVMFQNWKDQDVFQIGGAYKTSPQFTVRAGLNLANNPVPNFYMNPLFPAIIKNHVTAGVGYAFSKDSGIDVSLVIAPEVSATNGGGVTTKHSQMNMQLMYSQRF